MNASGIIRAVIGTMLLAAAAGGTAMALHYRARAAQVAEYLQRAKAPIQSILQPAPAADTKSTNATGSPPIQDAGLLARIRELEIQLQSSANLIASLQAAQTNRWQREDGPRRDRNEWMDELKTSDPARYKEIMDRREEARRMMNETFAAKAAHFLERDTSSMSEDEAAQYHQMINLLDDTWRLAESLNAEVPRDQRWPLMRQMRDNIEVLTPLLDAEREREFRQIAADFGYDDVEAEQFAAYMNNLVEITSMRSFFESMRPGGGPPGGPGRREEGVHR